MPYYRSNDPKRSKAYQKKLDAAAERKRVDAYSAGRKRTPGTKVAKTAPKKPKISPLEQLTQALTMKKKKEKKK